MGYIFINEGNDIAIGIKYQRLFQQGYFQHVLYEFTE